MSAIEGVVAYQGWSLRGVPLYTHQYITPPLPHTHPPPPSQLNRRKEQMAVALKQQQQELQEKRKRFDEDKRLFEEEHQRYMKELEDSMRFGPMYVWGCACV